MKMKISILPVPVVVFLFLVFGVCASSILQATPAAPGNGADVIVQLRLYEGFKQKEKINAVVVNSYFPEKLPGDSAHAGMQIEKEKASLAQIYNLESVENLSVMDIFLERGKENTGEIKLGRRTLLIKMIMKANGNDRFDIRVMEVGKKDALLETEIIIPEEKTAALGFKDAEERIFFFSFHREKDPGKKTTSKPVARINLPYLVKHVTAVYPPEALEKGIEGDVELRGIVDTDGRVTAVRVIGSVHPLLDQAAIESVSQWIYKPMITNGVPRTMEISFKLTFKIKDQEPQE